MSPQNFFPRALLQVLLAAAAVNADTYTWPSDTDHLETLLYEQIGHSTFGLAALVAPCNLGSPFGEGRSTPAEWLRTAYHDMATADVQAGTGGLDASIGFELDRDENPGTPKFNETIRNMIPFLTSQSSIADLIAFGATVSVATCSKGKVNFPFRGGRRDATQAGPTGVPEPQQDLDSHTAAFARQGFTATEMIGLVACGHTIGGVHGIDFPTIIDLPANHTVSLISSSPKRRASAADSHLLGNW